MDLPLPKQLWKNKSVEARSFVFDLLKKDPAHRPCIKDILMHKWFEKFSKGKVVERHNNSSKGIYTPNLNVFAIYK